MKSDLLKFKHANSAAILPLYHENNDIACYATLHHHHHHHHTTTRTSVMKLGWSNYQPYHNTVQSNRSQPSPPPPPLPPPPPSSPSSPSSPSLPSSPSSPSSPSRTHHFSHDPHCLDRPARYSVTSMSPACL
ncbi:hypothetical protein FHG87_010310 [Trinorchestia longiramus]|nr:hypothetical protein FHG87_010310 [Trinorchestia longiramus]